jgi:hypothetical protein
MSHHGYSSLTRPDAARSDQEGPEAGVHALVLEDALHLLEDELLNLVDVLENLSPTLCAAHLTLNPDIFDQASNFVVYRERTMRVGDLSRGRMFFRRAQISTSGDESFGVLRGEETQMSFPLDVSENTDTVESHACDVEFERDADEAGHRVIEEDFGRHVKFHVSRVGHVEDHLHVFGTALGLWSECLGLSGFVVFVEDGAWAVVEQAVIPRDRPRGWCY